MWGGEPTHQSLQTMKGAMSDSAVVKWYRSAPADVYWQFSAIADCDGDGSMEVIYGTAGAFVHDVYCRDGLTGSGEWSFTAADLVAASPAVGDVDGDDSAEVIVGSDNGLAGKVYCLRGKDGTEKWSLNAPSIVRTSPTIADPDKDGQPEILVGWQGSLRSLNGAGGTEWNFNMGNDLTMSSPAVADMDGDGQVEVVFGSMSYASANGKVYCLSGADGTQKWAYPVGGDIWSSPAVADLDGDGHMEVVIGCDDSTVYCIDGLSGTKDWSFKTGNAWVWSSPAIGDCDRDGQKEVVIGGYDRKVYCLDGATGNKEWEFLTAAPVHNPVSLADVDGDDWLEVPIPNYSPSDTLYCLNAEDGSLLWKKALAVHVEAPFVGDVDGDGCSEIVVGTCGSNGIWVLDDPGGAVNCGYFAETSEDRGPSGTLEFRPDTRGFYLFLPDEARVSLALYDASGRLVQSLYDGVLGQGGHTFVPDTEARGVYIVLLRHDGGTETVKLVR